MLSALLNRRMLERVKIAEDNAEAMRAILRTTTQQARLLAIEQTGRLIKFTFIRDNIIHTIETYSTMSDDISAWKRELLE